MHAGAASFQRDRITRPSYHPVPNALERSARRYNRRKNEERIVTIAPGTRFGPFEVLSLIDVGGMGEVYRARDLQLG